MKVTHVRILGDMNGVQRQIKDINLRADSPLETKLIRYFRAMKNLLVNGWKPTTWLFLWQGDGKIAIVEDDESVWH